MQSFNAMMKAFDIVREKKSHAEAAKINSKKKNSLDSMKLWRIKKIHVSFAVAPQTTDSNTGHR